MAEKNGVGTPVASLSIYEYFTDYKKKMFQFFHIIAAWLAYCTVFRAKTKLMYIGAFLVDEFALIYGI